MKRKTVKSKRVSSKRMRSKRVNRVSSKRVRSKRVRSKRVKRVRSKRKTKRQIKKGGAREYDFNNWVKPDYNKSCDEENCNLGKFLNTLLFSSKLISYTYNKKEVIKYFIINFDKLDLNKDIKYDKNKFMTNIGEFLNYYNKNDHLQKEESAYNGKQIEYLFNNFSKSNKNPEPPNVEDEKQAYVTNNTQNYIKLNFKSFNLHRLYIFNDIIKYSNERKSNIYIHLYEFMQENLTEEIRERLMKDADLKEFQKADIKKILIPESPIQVETGETEIENKPQVAKSTPENPETFGTIIQKDIQRTPVISPEYIDLDKQKMYTSQIVDIPQRDNVDEISTINSSQTQTSSSSLSPSPPPMPSRKPPKVDVSVGQNGYNWKFTCKPKQT